jgi:outer membrane receptor protein involved in Fe transport
MGGTPLYDQSTTDKFSQELRATLPIGQHVDWLLGAFYTYENSHWNEALSVVDPSTGATLESLGTFVWPTTYEEIAGFTDFTFKITPQFDIQLGARESRNRQTYSEVDDSPLEGILYPGHGNLVITPETESKDSSFTYLVTPRYKLSEDVMIYARAASGYRPGGPNPNYYLAQGPSSFQPDRTMNFEIGTKGSVLDRRLTFDASVYYINWKNIQIQVFNPATNVSYNTNGSHAKSEGAELAVNANPLTGLTLSAWVAWNEAVLTDPLPPPPVGTAIGNPGDRLPYSPRISAAVSAEQDFPLGSRVTGFVGASVYYVGDRVGNFPTSLPPPPRQVFPAYARTDMRLGARWDRWLVNAFATNLTNRRGILGGGNFDGGNPNEFTIIQPRTIGLLLTRTF